MNLPARDKRKEARRLYLSGECDTNAEIASRLSVKPHTVGRWRKEEDWDGLKLKIDRRAAEMFVEKIASDRVTLNVRHYRMWELLLVQATEMLKKDSGADFTPLEAAARFLDRVQKGQRLAKGMSLAGETEEAIRAQSQAEIRRLIDSFVDAVKENVADEETRESIRLAIFDALSQAAHDGAGESQDPLLQ
jgi:hypothetical protein